MKQMSRPIELTEHFYVFTAVVSASAPKIILSATVYYTAIWLPLLVRCFKTSRERPSVSQWQLFVSTKQPMGSDAQLAERL